MFRFGGSGVGLVFSRRLAAPAGQNLNGSHHAAVLVFEQMAVVDKSADAIGIAEIHPQANARIGQALAVPEGDVDCVAQERLADGNAKPLHENEMDLVNVKGVEFLRAIFDDPVFDLPLVGDDIRNI